MDRCFIDKLNLPNKLNLPEDLTFGIEIEFENIKFSSVRTSLEELKRQGIIDSNWRLKAELSLDSYGDNSLGGEIVSPILVDSLKSYEEISIICKMLTDMNGRATTRCAGHIHIGANILEENLIYYSRLAKLWVVFENEIVKFGLGEFDYVRDTMASYAASATMFLRYVDDFEKGLFGDITFENFAKFFGMEKRLTISFYYLGKNKPINTIEIRCPNGTLDYRIWKNNINFFTKLVLACRDDNKDWNLIEKMFQEEKDIEYDDYSCEDNNLEKFRFLVDFIFDDELDIENFMLQYKNDSFKYLVR